MAWFEIITVIILASAGSWFLSAAVHCDPHGQSWKLVRQWLATTVMLTCFNLIVSNVGFWFHYHHLVAWQSDVLAPVLWSAMAAWILYREAKRQKDMILKELNRAQADGVGY